MLWIDQLNFVWALHLHILLHCRNHHVRTYWDSSLDLVAQNFISVISLIDFLGCCTFDIGLMINWHESGILIQFDCQAERNPMTAQTKNHTDLNSRSFRGFMLSDWMYLVYTWYIPGIYQYILCIYFVYMLSIYYVYTQYIHSYVYAQYILCICHIYYVYTLYMYCIS